MDHNLTSRGSSISKRWKQKMDEIFLERKYVIIKEFFLSEGEVFESPLKSKARHGFILQEISNPLNRIAVGKNVLKRAAMEYDAVEIPKKNRGRPRKAN